MSGKASGMARRGFIGILGVAPAVFGQKSQTKEMFESNAAYLYMALFKEIAAKYKARKANQPFYVIMSDTHDDKRSLLVQFMVMNICKRLGIKDYHQEMTEKQADELKKSDRVGYSTTETWYYKGNGPYLWTYAMDERLLTKAIDTGMTYDEHAAELEKTAALMRNAVKEKLGIDIATNGHSVRLTKKQMAQKEAIDKIVSPIAQQEEAKLDPRRESAMAAHIAANKKSVLAVVGGYHVQPLATELGKNASVMVVSSSLYNSKDVQARESMVKGTSRAGVLEWLHDKNNAFLAGEALAGIMADVKIKTYGDMLTIVETARQHAEKVFPDVFASHMGNAR